VLLFLLFKWHIFVCFWFCYLYMSVYVRFYPQFVSSQYFLLFHIAEGLDFLFLLFAVSFMRRHHCCRTRARSVSKDSARRQASYRSSRRSLMARSESRDKMEGSSHLQFRRWWWRQGSCSVILSSTLWCWLKFVLYQYSLELDVYVIVLLNYHAHANASSHHCHGDRSFKIA